ncbi:MAG: MAPEG family protein [Pseudomonadota bacterium]
MPAELFWLALTVTMTGLMWVYVFVLVAQLGFGPAMRDPVHDTPYAAPWAQRAKRAHANAVENLAIFAPLVLVLHAAEISTSATVAACAVYFVARALHYGVYVAAVPWARTPLFMVGFLAQATLAVTLLRSSL